MEQTRKHMLYVTNAVVLESWCNTAHVLDLVDSLGTE